MAPLKESGSDDSIYLIVLSVIIEHMLTGFTSQSRLSLVIKNFPNQGIGELLV